MSITTDNLVAAWHHRRFRDVRIFGAALEAPALFKPETVTDLDRDIKHATAQARYWARQGATR